LEHSTCRRIDACSISAGRHATSRSLQGGLLVIERIVD
jgi:hypothetical protein